MSYEITKKELSAQAVLVARRRVALAEIPATMGEVLSKLFQLAQEQGLALSGKPFTRYLDVGPDLMTIEPGMRFVLPEGSPAGVPTQDVAGEPRRDILPGGLAATTVHKGPYDQLGGAYTALEKWMANEGFVPAGPPWESYITDPHEHPDPKDWKTEILWPIQPA